MSASPVDWLVRRRFGLFLVLAGLIYGNSFTTPFLFDDVQGILENNGLHQLWPPVEVMRAPLESTPYGRPITTYSLALNYRLSGVQPWSYHAVNFLIHLAAALTLCGLLRLALGHPSRPAWVREYADGLALAIAVLWLAHPLATNVVTYTVQRAESLMGFAYLVVLYAVARSVPGGSSFLWPVLAVSAAWIGMGCKETMMTVPAAALLLDRFVFQQSWARIWQRRKWLYFGLLSAWLGLAWLMHLWPRLLSVGAHKISHTDYFLMQWQVVWHYLRLTVWPVGLCLDYAWPKVSFAAAWPAGLGLLALLGGSLGALRKWPGAGFCGVLFFLILAPTSSVIPIVTSLAAEHRVYLPAAAVLTLLVIGGWAMWRRVASPVRLAGAISCVGFVLVAFSLTTLLRNEDYASTVGMWQEVVRQQPQHARAWNNLGGAYWQSGRRELAQSYFEKAVELDPDYADAFSNLGLCVGEAGDRARGISLLARAVELEPNHAAALGNLGLLYWQEGQLPQAAICYRHVLSSNPQNGLAHFRLALIEYQQKHYAESLSHAEAVLRLEPDNAEARNLRQKLTEPLTTP